MTTRVYSTEGTPIKTHQRAQKKKTAGGGSRSLSKKKGSRSLGRGRLEVETRRYSLGIIQH